jgi:hypothetical protein
MATVDFVAGAREGLVTPTLGKGDALSVAVTDPLGACSNVAVGETLANCVLVVLGLGVGMVVGMVKG